MGYNINPQSVTFEVRTDGTVDGAHEIIDEPSAFLEAAAATVYKAWFDGENTAARTAITFTAEYSTDDGNTWTALPGKTLTVTGEAANQDGIWVARFEGLPSYVNGKPAQWRAVEAAIPGYFAATSTVAGAEGMIARNLVDNGSGRPVAGVEISKVAVGGGAELPGATTLGLVLAALFGAGAVCLAGRRMRRTDK